MDNTFPIYSILVHTTTIFLSTSFVLYHRFIRLCLFLSVVFISLIITMLLLPDYLIYLEIYNSLNPNLKLNEQDLYWVGEPLYLRINHFFKRFTDDFSYLHFFFIFIPLSIKVLFILKWGKVFITSFLFYIALMFFPDAYLIRSTIASGFILMSIWALLKNKNAYYFFIPVIFGSGIHITALVALPLWFFKKTTFTRTKSLLILGFFSFLGLIGIGHLIGNFFFFILPNDWYAVSLIGKYSQNLYSDSVGLLRFSVLIFIIIIFLYISYEKNIIEFFPNYNIILITCFYSLFFLICFNDFGILADRLFRLFSFAIVIAFGQICFCFKRNQRFFILCSLILIFNIIPYFTIPRDVAFIN